MRIALVHEYLDKMGGAERVLRVFHKIFPNAPIYTFIWDEALRQYFPNADVRASFLRRLPRCVQRRRKYLLPLLPIVPETFDLANYDLVISSSSAFAKGIIVKPCTLHICYCHAPSRFLWDWTYEYVAEQGAPTRMCLARPLIHYIRMWDKQASSRVDYFIANSKYTRERIWKYYRRESDVIYPPVYIPPSFEPANAGRESYFLVVSNLVAYKRVDLAVEAFNKLELPLIIIGDGPERKRLERMARRNVRFLGWLSDEDVRSYFSRAAAVIFAGEDDFGIVPVEAMAYGVPVLAYRKGGAVETVDEGITGEFFDDPAPEILADGVRRIRERLHEYNKAEIRKRAMRFSEDNFIDAFQKFLSRVSKTRLRERVFSETRFTSVRGFFKRDKHQQGI